MEKTLPTSSRWVFSLQTTQMLRLTQWFHMTDVTALRRNSSKPLGSTTRQTWRLSISSGLQRRAEGRSTAGSSSRQKVRIYVLIWHKIPLKITSSSVNQCSTAALSVCFLSDKIKDLLKPGTVSPMTRLALVNAIYFKGNWKSHFDEANTKDMTFKVNQVKSADVEA